MEDTSQFIYGMYARKSSESEDRQIQSIERQIDDLQETQQKERLKIFGLPIKEAKSAFTLGREGFQELISLTQKGKINAWLCWHANRLSRNPIDAGMIIYLMDIGKLHHIKTPTRSYFNNPTDKMMLQIEFTMSKKDSDDKSLFVKSGLEKRYKKGLPTGKAPVGFINDKSKEKGDRGWLVDAERTEKIKKLFREFLTGNYSVRAITNYADKVLMLTIPTKDNPHGHPLSSSQMDLLLKQTVYAGFFYSKHKHDPNKSMRRELAPGIPRIITEGEHYTVLAILSGRRSPILGAHQTLYRNFIHGPKGEFVAADHKFQLICNCGRKFAYRQKKECPGCALPINKMSHPTYLRYTYYYNLSKKKARLSYRGIEETQINSFFDQYIKENIIIHPVLCTWVKNHLRILKERLIESLENQKNLSGQLNKQIEMKLERLLNIYLAGSLDEESYRSKSAAIKKDAAQFEENSQDSFGWYEYINQVLTMCTSAHKIFHTGSIETKRAFMKLIGTNLVWNEERLYFSSPKWFEVLINGLSLYRTNFAGYEPKQSLNNKGQMVDINTICPNVLRCLDTVRKLVILDKGFTSIDITYQTKEV